MIDEARPWEIPETEPKQEAPQALWFFAVGMAVLLAFLLFPTLVPVQVAVLVTTPILVLVGIHRWSWNVRPYQIDTTSTTYRIVFGALCLLVAAYAGRSIWLILS